MICFVFAFLSAREGKGREGKGREGRKEGRKEGKQEGKKEGGMGVEGRTEGCDGGLTFHLRFTYNNLLRLIAAPS